MNEGGVTDRIRMAPFGNNGSNGSDITETKSLSYSTLPEHTDITPTVQVLLLKT